MRQCAREVFVDEETFEDLDAQTSMEAHHHITDVFELNASMGKLNDCLSRLEPAQRSGSLWHHIEYQIRP